MKKTRFSIIMPVWNRAALVTRAIQSVVAQTFKDYELLIIDDGSEDHLEETIGPYLSQNVLSYRIPHSGVSAARNFGLKRARGDYLAYLDSDNVWHPQFLSRMNETISKGRARRDVAYCRYNIYKKRPSGGETYLDSVGGRRFRFKTLVAGNYVDLNGFVHSKECLREVGFFDETLRRLNDWDFILRMTSKHKPVFIPDVLVDYYFCIAANAISFLEDGRLPEMLIREKYMNTKHNIEHFHDTIPYRWKNVPDKKFHNWLKMSEPRINTSDFAADGFPFMLQIEPTNVCNLSCSLCPAAAGKTELNRKRRHMRLEEFKSIVDDLEEYLLFLVMWNWGEPLINPQFPAMIQYASERDMRTVTSTNAHFLHNNEYVAEILRSGLSTMIVAIDSLDETNYNVYRKKGDLAKCLAGLESLVALKKRIKSRTLINLRMVIMRHNVHELKAMRRFAKKLGVDVFSVKTVNPSCGRLSSQDQEIVPECPDYRRYVYKEGSYERVRADAVCTRIWQMSNIFSNGDVVPCCFDYAAELKIGNVFEEPLSRIWNGPAYRELRKKIFTQKDSIPKCRECDINFQLSKNGWFVESRHFWLPLSTRLEKAVRSLAKSVLPEAAVERIRKRKRKWT